MERKNVGQRFPKEESRSEQGKPGEGNPGSGRKILIRKPSQEDSGRPVQPRNEPQRYSPRPDGSNRPPTRPEYGAPRYPRQDDRPRYSDRNTDSRPGYGERRGDDSPRYAGNSRQPQQFREPGMHGLYTRNQDGGDRRSGYHRKSPPKPQKLGPGMMYSPPAHPEGIRINRYIANAGICSRRDADKLVESGDISVNGKVVTTLGTRIDPGDVVALKGVPIKGERLRYILLNKPKGYITTADDPEGRATVIDLIAEACPERLFPVGRLDKNTTGLLLFTNDGHLAEKLMHPRNLVKKLYHVRLDKPLTREHLIKITKGIKLEDGWIKPDEISYVGSVDDGTEIGMEIHSGKNRIVRRIFESLGYEVTKLDRVMFAGLTKKDLRRGKWRPLTQEELNFLKML